VSKSQTKEDDPRLAGGAKWFGDQFGEFAIGISQVACVDLASAAFEEVASVVLDEIERKLGAGLGLLDEIAGLHLTNSQN